MALLTQTATTAWHSQATVLGPHMLSVTNYMPDVPELQHRPSRSISTTCTPRSYARPDRCCTERQGPSKHPLALRGPGSCCAVQHMCLRHTSKNTLPSSSVVSPDTCFSSTGPHSDCMHAGRFSTEAAPMQASTARKGQGLLSECARMCVQGQGAWQQRHGTDRRAGRAGRRLLCYCYWVLAVDVQDVRHASVVCCGS